MCRLAADHKHGQGTAISPPTDLSFIPNNDLSRKAYEHCAARLHPSILNHSIRVFLIEKHINSLLGHEMKGASHDTKKVETLIFMAAIFHDMGTYDELNGEERFEVCGADAAVEFMKTHAADMAFDETERHSVWMAIALHTSPGLAERIAPLAKVLRLAVLTDFHRPGLATELKAEELCQQLEAMYPRLSIEKELGGALVHQIKSKSEGKERLKKAPNNSWTGSLWRGEVEGAYTENGVNKYF